MGNEMNIQHNRAHDLNADDIEELTQWRRDIHRHPEVSGEEIRTAAAVAAMLEKTNPTQIISSIGGHGVSAIYDSGIAGPRVLLRCELDGLPIQDLADIPHRSIVEGKGHQCGHDGHMAILAATARLLGLKGPATGAVILMFQPAEEDGSGARKVVDDPAFAKLAPDYSFAIHNMPGRPFGTVDIIDGPACCASRGLTLTLTGKTAHASQPETGISPMHAISELMPRLTSFSSPLGTPLDDPGFRMITVTHVNMGAAVFGVAPGKAHLFATLRTLTNDDMSGLVQRVEALAKSIAADEGLDLQIDYQDVFVTCSNDAEAADIVRTAMDDLGIPHGPGILPIRASEDFGHFGETSRAAILLLGSGDNLPALHNPDFDFPDELIPIGAKIFMQILHRTLNAN
jgi:amidohydrolase